MARRRAASRPDAPSAAMLKLNYDSFVRWGRMWEVELIALDVLKRPEQRDDWLTLGPKMMLKGKINPTAQARRHAGHEAHGRRPPRASPSAEAPARRTPAPTPRGASHDARPSPTTPAARCTARPASSTRASRPRPRALDLTLQEIPGWECCGNTAAHSINRLLAAALPVNELAKVEQDMKLDAVAVPCAACFSRFKTGAHEVAESEQTAADVRAVVGRAYNGGVAVDNLVDVYHDAVGLEELEAKVTQAVRRPQGRLLLRLPAHPAAQGHAGRRPRVPHAHGRGRRGARLRAGATGTTRPTAAAPRWRSPSRASSTTSSAASSPTPRRAAPRPSSSPARSAR